MALAAERYAPRPAPEPRRRARCPLPAPPPPQPQPWRPPEKDYSVPLHVDCSVEYELPDCAKPPQGVKVEPLLMIHPAHFRRLDSLRRCPFVNNLPVASGSGGAPFELPPPPTEAPRRQDRPCRPRPAKPSPERERERERRWSAACCRNPYEAAPPQPDPYAPKEGDTLENSTFGKCQAARARHPRHRLAAHPYAPDPSASALVSTTAAAMAADLNCDKTFDALQLQGNPLISPFHAKMFSSESVYQNYPIVMYK